MKLVLMTKPTFFVEEDKILSNLLDEGMDILHIYKPESSPMFLEITRKWWFMSTTT